MQYEAVEFFIFIKVLCFGNWARLVLVIFGFLWRGCVVWDGLEILFSFSLLDIIYVDFIFNHLIINFFFI